MPTFSGQFTRENIISLIDNQALTTWFQPIFSRRSGEVYGYEALTRLAGDPHPGGDIGQLFAKAQEVGLIPSLDMLCRGNAFHRATKLGFAQQETFLYLNICPATLMHPEHKVGMTDQFAERHGIAKERIILEITEQEVIRNYELFKRSVGHYRKQGYKIAIDDFGAGYGGLKMLSIIKPDYVKVDRHFISGIDQDSFKHTLVDAMATVCHKLGITVIAEGIERDEELAAVSRFGIELFQGYLLERPAPVLSRERIVLPSRARRGAACPRAELDICTIGALAKEVETLTSAQPLLTAHQRFMADETLQAIPIVDRERLVGMLCRKRFLEQQMIGPYGYGFALSTHRTIQDALDEPEFLVVEANMAIEEVVRKIQTRRSLDLGNDLGVCKNGKYLGTVAINDLLSAITQKNLQLAKGANPLSGLPGNSFIQRALTLLIAEKVSFAVCYVDIDHFKPYNDHYSFEKGDTVIKTLGDLIVDSAGGGEEARLPFVGHVGGDDFIVVTHPHLAEQTCRQIIAEFEKLLIFFHGPREHKLGYYPAKDRQGVECHMPLMSLSIGIVNTERCLVDSYGELALLLSGVKHAAKEQPGSAIVSNRRQTAELAPPALSRAA